MESKNKSIKKIVESQKIETIDSDFLYKLIAFLIVAILLYFSYKVSKDGLEFIPFIGKYLDAILDYFNMIVYYIAKLFKYILESI